MKFKYLKFPAEPTEAFPDRKYALRPVLPVTIENNGKKIKYFVLVDSGADHNIFHAAIGEELGIDVKSGKIIQFWGVSNNKQTAYYHNVKVSIGGWEHDCFIGFSYDIEHMPYGLLGQDDFFKKFKIIFDYSKKQFELKEKINKIIF